MSISADFSLDALPEWLPDETLFSLVSRYHRLAGHVASHRTARILFGSARSGYQHDLPSGLDHFVKVTCRRYGHAEEIARSRTLLPYYLPFRSRAVANNAIAAMRSPRIGHLKYQLGVLTSGFRAHHPLRACAECMRIDEKTYGVAHWHFAHQMPGVLSCYKHQRPLLVSTLKVSGVARFGYVLPDIACDHTERRPDLAAPIDRRRLLHRLALASRRIVSIGRQARLRPEHMRRTRYVALSDRGLVTANGRIRMQQATESFEKYLSPILELPEFASLSEYRSGLQHTLTRILHAPGDVSHPMRHILATLWLFGDWEAYERCARSPLPDDRFEGAPPESSLPSNDDSLKRDQFYRCLTDKKMSITSACREVGVDVATGFGWARSHGHSARPRPRKIKGALLRRIEGQLSAGLPKKLIAEDLKISRSTVSRVMRASPELPDKWSKAKWERERTAARDNWSALLNDYGHLGRKSIRSLEPAVYAWLYRNDRAWLDESQKSLPNATHTRRTHVDWCHRDQLLAAELRMAAAHIVETTPQTKLTLGLLCQRAPDLKRRLGQLEQMPRTKIVLAEILKQGRKPSQDDSFPLT